MTQPHVIAPEMVVGYDALAPDDQAFVRIQCSALTTILEVAPAFGRAILDGRVRFDSHESVARCLEAAAGIGTPPSKSGQASICLRRRGRGQRTTALAEAIVAIFSDFECSMSTRQVFYQCVSRRAVENNPREAARVQRLLVDLRRDGTISYNRVVDRTRGKHQAPGWDGVAELLEAGAVQYRRDLWTDQPTVVMVACEKQALEGIFAEAVDEYGASLWTLRGYSSESFAFEWATEIRELADRGKRVVIAYFGDHDPSGLDIEQDTKAKLARFGGTFEWQRHGLLETDFETFELVNVPVKRTDSRARPYLERFGDRAAELDALSPTELRRRIEGAILEHVNLEAWERLKRIEAAERESLSRVAENWQRAIEAVR